MPYFKVNTPAGGAINSNIFNSKEKAALSYYNQKDDQGNSLFDKLTASYFVGTDNPTVLNYSEGSTNQKNDAHVIEFLAALSIIDFLSKDRDTLLSERQYEFGIQAPIDLTGIQLNHLDNTTQEKFTDFIARMALAFRYFEEYVYSGRIPLRQAYYNRMNLQSDINRGDYDDLCDFIDDFNEWLDEMSIQRDAFKPFLNKSRVENTDTPVAADLGDYICGFEAQEGGMFSSGSSYKDFSGYCDKFYQKYGSSMVNTQCAFLKIMYDAADRSLDYYNEL